MKKSVLFLPASIRSHILPALYLADLLSKDHEIYFSVTNDVLEELVTGQGYQVVRSGRIRVALGMERQYLTEQKGKAGKWETLKSIWNNDLYEVRQKELGRIVDQIKPVAIFIDIFNSTDILVLYPKYKDIKLVFVNPMLSTYRVNGFPTVDQGHWPEHHAAKNDLKTKKGIPLKYFITSPLDVWIGKAINDQFEKLTRADGFSQKHPVAKDKTSALLFDNIPEIMLAPLELEVSSEVRKPNQHYLGLCISEHRQDTELDSSFENRFQEIVDRKKVGNHLIYCTFGTFYQGSDRALLDFLNKLLGAIQELENVDAIFSVNKLVIETLRYQRKIPANIHMFSRVPQLRVLQHADLFVTHGGLGSVKESIYYGVPMLVYPLDLQYDQNGNGLKVEHHGLGLRGVFSYERSGDMKKKILELLEDRSYTQNIRKFREICQTSYSSDKLNHILNQILLHP
jgi:UDP:flavonoid glycosyltransferase YjiC (YdhE family)